MTARSLATSAQARDLDAARQLLAMRQEPVPAEVPAAGPRTPHGSYSNARYRAGARLARAHPGEFTRYLHEELAALDEAPGSAA
jgi:hypothetical protein